MQHPLHCLAWYFIFSSLPPKVFSSLCILKSRKSLRSGSCLRPLGVCFSGNWRSSELDSLQFWTSDIQDLPTLCRKFLYFAFLFVISVLYTKKKNRLKRAQFSVYNTTFFRPSYSFPQNWVITEVLVCSVYIFYEFAVLDNSIRLLYFHFCFYLSSLCLQWLHHGLYLPFAQVLSFHTCTITWPFLRSADLFFSSACLSLFGHVECPS